MSFLLHGLCVMCKPGVIALPKWIGWMENDENEGHLIIASDRIFEKLTTSEVRGIESTTIIKVDVFNSLRLTTQKSGARFHYNLTNK